MGINVKFDTSGLDRLKKKIRDVSRPRKVPVRELFNPQFMRKHSKYASLDELIEKANVSADEFEKMSSSAKDDLIRKTTKFSSWQRMLNAAAAANVKKEFSKLPGNSSP